MIALAIIPALFPIIYEDFRYRAIHWIWVAVLLFTIVFSAPWEAKMVGMNLLFTVFQLIFLSIYFSIREGCWVNIIDRYLGLGDVVFFIPLFFLFSLFNFVLFFTGSLILSLFGFVIVKTFFIKKIETIPLAGCMAIVLSFILLGQEYLAIDLQSDVYWLDLLQKI